MGLLTELSCTGTAPDSSVYGATIGVLSRGLQWRRLLEVLCQAHRNHTPTDGTACKAVISACIWSNHRLSGPFIFQGLTSWLLRLLARPPVGSPLGRSWLAGISRTVFAVDLLHGHGALDGITEVTYRRCLSELIIQHLHHLHTNKACDTHKDDDVVGQVGDTSITSRLANLHLEQQFGFGRLLTRDCLSEVLQKQLPGSGQLLSTWSAAGRCLSGAMIPHSGEAAASIAVSASPLARSLCVWLEHDLLVPPCNGAFSSGLVLGPPARLFCSGQAIWPGMRPTPNKTRAAHTFQSA